MHNVNPEELLIKGAKLADILALFEMPVLDTGHGTADPDAATVPPKR